MQEIVADRRGMNAEQAAGRVVDELDVVAPIDDDADRQPEQGALGLFAAGPRSPGSMLGLGDHPLERGRRERSESGRR